MKPKNFSLLTLCLIFTCYFLSPTSSLYFELIKDTNRCFFEEFYSEDVVTIRYEILEKSIMLQTQNSNRMTIIIEGLESNHKVYLPFTLDKLKGKISFHVDYEGLYSICIHSNDKDYFNHRNELKMKLLMDTDKDEVENAEDVVKNKEFSSVEKSVRKIATKCNDVIRMENWQLNNEEQFSKSQVESSQKIIFMTVVQIAIICVVGLLQIYFLRKVFKERAWVPF